MRVSKGRAKKGISPINIVPAIKNKNISICSAINKNNVVYYKINLRPYNTNSFLGYISEIIDYFNLNNYANCLFIMDNASIHKSNLIKEKIVQSNNILEFLPPYTPQFNPIENFFSK